MGWWYYVRAPLTVFFLYALLLFLAFKSAYAQTYMPYGSYSPNYSVGEEEGCTLEDVGDLPDCTECIRYREYNHSFPIVSSDVTCFGSGACEVGSVATYTVPIEVYFKGGDACSAAESGWHTVESDTIEIPLSISHPNTFQLFDPMISFYKDIGGGWGVGQYIYADGYAEITGWRPICAGGQGWNAEGECVECETGVNTSTGECWPEGSEYECFIPEPPLPNSKEWSEVRAKFTYSDYNIFQRVFGAIYDARPIRDFEYFTWEVLACEESEMGRAPCKYIPDGRIVISISQDVQDFLQILMIMTYTFFFLHVIVRW